MELEALRDFLGWCTIFNFVFLLLWWATFAFAGDWVYRTHGRWFKISREAFEITHYAAMAVFKALVIFFNLVPYLVLRLCL